MISMQCYSGIIYSGLMAVTLFTLPARGTNQQPGAEEWAPISKEEWALNDDPSNPGASAIILYREVDSDDVKSFETHSYRIKILTEEGKKYGDITIPYGEKLYIEGIRARTVQPDGSVIEFSGEIFDKLVVKTRKLRFQAKAFTLAGVRPGCIIEYSYQKRWHEKIPDYLQNPERYIIDFSDAILAAKWTIDEDLFTRRARFCLRPLLHTRVVSDVMGLPREDAPRKQSDGSWLLELSNVPAFREEEFMPPESALRTRVEFFYVIGLGSDPGSFWQSNGKRMALRFGKFIGDSKDMKRVVDDTLAAGDSPETKLRKLYTRAQQIRFISFENHKTEKEEKRESLRENKNATDVLKHGYAFANEINLLFVALARAAGFDSAPVMVSPRDVGFFQKNLLERDQLTAMVAWVKAGDKDYYFDPATRFCPFNLLPWNETGTGGIKVENDNTSLVDTPNPRSVDAVVERKAFLRINGEGGLDGTLRVRFRGQEALQLRLQNREHDDAGRRKALEDEIKGWLPSGSTTELTSVGKWEDATESLEAEFKLTIANYGTATRQRLVLPLGVFESTAVHAFQNSRRLHPVYFPYPHQELDEVTLQLPADRKVEALPAPRSYTTIFGNYNSSYYENGVQSVKYQRRLVMDGIFFGVQQYPLLRAFFDDVRAGDEEPVVLRNAR